MRLCLTFARLSSTASDLSHVRSLLFAPGSDERKLRKQGVGEGRGVLALNGAMVDLPVVERARRVLAEAERSSA